MRQRHAAAAALAAWLVARSSLGAGARAPCITSVVQPGALDEAGRARLAEQLAASLGQHDIAACGAGETPVAEVTFEAANDGAEIAIRVRDALTGKEVTRVVRVRAIPRDGRPLALAVAADELLRASWAEMLLARAPAPPPPPPPQVRALLEQSLAPRGAERREAAPSAPTEPGRLVLGAALAGEHATGGLTLGGVDARLGFWAADRVSLAVRFGARTAITAAGADGSASASAVVAGGGLGLALLPRGRAVGVEVPVRVDLEALQFTAHPAPGATGSEGRGAAVSASAGLSVSARIAAGWRVNVEGVIGAVVRPVEAQDGGRALTAMAGAVVGAALGIGGEL